MKKNTLYLVCNAHLDPVWLWEWEEGLAETLSTFRTAAELCEEYNGFAFCHNESLLYQWIESYEPALFARIQRLVSEKRWHIMGGWYVQPDCNIPAGESFVRQILIAKKYFKKKFNVEPRTAINFDPFGHTRGLVQILAKSGYHSYVFCRPDRRSLDELGEEIKWIELEDFAWIGYDGSEITAHHIPDHYNSWLGKADDKVRMYIEKNTGKRNTGILLWGIGNHGGGPSREDVEKIAKMQQDETRWDIVHGRPEDYFEARQSEAGNLPRVEKELNPFAVGCYTSMSLVKKLHRQLENEYLKTEKMAAQAAVQNLMEYPKEELRDTLENILYCEFHDILPGDGIAEVETEAVRKLNYGLEIVNRIRAQAFFALLSGERKAVADEFPLFVYNPHPHELEHTVVMEFQPSQPNFDLSYNLVPEIKDEDGNLMTVQLEKVSCNIRVDQRKRVAFRTVLKPCAMNRFTCFLKKEGAGARQILKKEASELLTFKTSDAEVIISEETGLLERYRVNGVDYLESGAAGLLVIDDYPDPWGMQVRAFRDVIGKFGLMDSEESARFSGLEVKALPPVHIVEDGPVRTIVEALFRYNDSKACVRYTIPKNDSEIGIEVRVFWMEKDKMLKLSLPSLFKDGIPRGQVAYGVEEFRRHGEELVAQKWVSVTSNDRKHALTLINDSTYGFDFKDGELRISMLRSAAYAAHPVEERIPIVRQDRFEPRLDQGERLFKFWLNAGDASQRNAKIESETLLKSETPMALCCFPDGIGEKVTPAIVLSDDMVQLSAMKLAEEGERLIIRLFEPTGSKRETRVRIEPLKVDFQAKLDGFEIKTFAIDMKTGAHAEVDLLERDL